MTTNKEKYRNLCLTEDSIPIFLKDWWLDAVCGENWDVALVSNGVEIYGALPYSISIKMGMSFITMPKLTTFLGPWLKYPEGQKYASRLSFEMNAFQDLIKQLPSFDLFRQRFHYSIINWLPFYWKGFEQTTRYTYVVDLNNLDQVFNEFKSNVRGKIRKATGIVSVMSEKSIEDFYNIFSLTFQRQNIKPPVTLEFMQKIDQVLIAKNQRKIFFAIDGDGRIHSALYLIWDNLSAYVHMVGENPELRNSGAGSLLIWQAIQFSKRDLKLSRFDFLGSMIETIEMVRRSFGGKQVSYFQIKKVNSFLLRCITFFRKDSAAL